MVAEALKKERDIVALNAGVALYAANVAPTMADGVKLALKALATAKPVVDRYFYDVMVMADDAAVRANRLALLSGVAATMNRVADISKL